MLQVEDLSYSFSKDTILNYERKLIQTPFDSLPQPVSSHHSKYSVCELYAKVQELVQDAPYNLRWIGNSSSAPISAYIYALLMLAVTSPKSLLQFKNTFYELARKYLDVKQQKLIIEFLCLLQFSSDKFLFLKKYPLIDSIIFSVFDKLQAQLTSYHEDEHQNQYSQGLHDSSRLSSDNRASTSINLEMEDSTTGQLFQMNKLAELYAKFGLKFYFLKWSKSSESSFLLTIDEQRKMYIIVEREYFFVLQILQKTEQKSKKSKLSKGDKIEVERLLSYSQTESQISFHQKLNYLSQCAADKEIVKSKHDPFNTHHTVDSQSNRKDIIICNPKSLNALQNIAQPKKQYKFSYFTKKLNLKSQQVHQSIIHEKQKQNQKESQKESPIKKMDYIDLMESSFQQEKTQQVDKNHPTKQVQESHSLKFYTPKFLFKPLHSPAQGKKKKKSFDQNPNKTQTLARRGRSPSQAQKKIVPIPNAQQDKKSQRSKQIKFYSPPRIFTEIPDKKNFKKLENQQKKAHDLDGKEKRKEEPKYFDKKYNQKKQEIHQNHLQKDPKNTENSNLNKIKTSFSYNPKIFNNRISLQTRKDLDLLAKYKLPTQELVLNQIPEVDRSQEASKREIFEKKKIIRQELSQSLNNKSEVLLKKRIFEHLGTKFAGENLSFIPKGNQKSNKSLQNKEKNQHEQVQNAKSQENQKERKFSVNKECPQVGQEGALNGGFEIRIISAESEQTLRGH